MSAPVPNLDELVAQVVSLTSCTPAEAQEYLTLGDGNIETAIALYYDAQEDTNDTMPGDDEQQDMTPPQQQQAGGARTLAGEYVPPAPTSTADEPSRAPASNRPAQRGVAGARTLRDLQGGGGGGHGPGHGHAHDDDDDDDDDQDDEQQDFFAGGEKSGLAVQNPGQSNPRDQINNILRRARQNTGRPGGDDERPAQSRFRGTGMTLGADDTPSQAIPDPHAEIPQPVPRAHRELHLWRDGFSVDDGPLFRYDDPANARTLEMINTGHAPLHILNVEHGQEVDVEVHPHKDEDYKQPKKKFTPFGGQGQRLGSPTPGVTSTPSPAPVAASSTTAASASTASAQPSVDIDSSTPTITLQIRLGDGTRLQSRFNTTHTVGDVYSFVDAANPASQQREYALMTTFPSKDLTDKSQVLGDMAEFKRGGVVVQKWK